MNEHNYHTKQIQKPQTQQTGNWNKDFNIKHSQCYTPLLSISGMVCLLWGERILQMEAKDVVYHLP